MVDRRKFIGNGLLMAGMPFLAGKDAQDFAPAVQGTSPNSDALARIRPKAGHTYYISHRGVHLKQRAAGENTIESLRLAKRAGFQCVEFDVRFTRDNKAVVIHDETINRTLRDLHGNKLSSPIYVKDLTFDQIRSDYSIFTENKKADTKVPSFEEYLEACRLYKVIPFVEIKEHGISKSQYDALISSLDTIIGRENYVITSNNKVNDKIRGYGYNDIAVMGILYQTTFDHIRQWQNSIMAISASRFSPAEMKKHVQLSNQSRIPTESHADTIDKYNQVIRNGIDFISTDALMPELTGQGQIVAIKDMDEEEMSELKTSGQIKNSIIELKTGEAIDISLDHYSHYSLYGVTLELKLAGKCELTFNNKSTSIETTGSEYFRYPVLLHKESFQIKLNATMPSAISSLRITITKF